MTLANRTFSIMKKYQRRFSLIKKSIEFLIKAVSVQKSLYSTLTQKLIDNILKSQNKLTKNKTKTNQY